MAANRPQKTSGTTSAMNDTNQDTDTAERSDVSHLAAAPTGPNTYTVLSGVNAYSVDIAQLTCTCEDYQYNVSGDDDRNVCKHLEKAISIHPHPDGYYTFKGGRVERVDVTQSGAPSKAEAEAVEATEAAAVEVDPDDAHDRLKTSLGGTGIAFKTQLDGDRIWFAFDEYVEEDGTFGRYISDPDVVEYKPDAGPSGYKNYIAAGDVEDYVTGVLE